MNLEEQIALANEALKEARDIHHVTGEFILELVKRRESLMDEKFKNITEEDILSNLDLAKEFIREVRYGTPAWDKWTQWIKAPKDFYNGGSDPREEYYGYPTLTATFRRNQPVEQAAIDFRAWLQKWALGRTEIELDILEYSCSENGSWSSWYDIENDTLVVSVRRWSVKEEVFQGHLEAGLWYIAQNVWYEKSDLPRLPCPVLDLQPKLF